MFTLASTSETRKRMLSAAGLTFQTAPARIDEEAMRRSLEVEGASPRDMADVLSEAKARRVAQSGQVGLVLGSDQILSCEGRVYQKARTMDEAFETLTSLSGRTHLLHSGAVFYEDARPVWRSIGAAKLTMHPLTEKEISDYLSETWPDVSGSVGAYHAEGLGVQLFSRIDGDWFSVLGLPLLDVLSYLRLRGGSVHER